MNRREFVAAAAFSLQSSRPRDLINLTVEAGRLNRRDVVVSFPFPGAGGKSQVLRDNSGKTTPLQVALDCRFHSLVELLARNECLRQITS